MRYLQLAHNEWDPAAKPSRPKVLLQLRPRGPARPGRDQAAGRVADPAARPGHRPARPTRPGRTGWRSPRSRPFGGTWCWTRCGAGWASTPSMTRLLAGRRRDPRTERVLFALVANRALAPSRSWPPPDWINRRRAHRRPGRDQRRRLLPGDGLAARDRDDLEREVFWPGRHPAQPRGRPAVLRHHLHLLRDRRPRRAGRRDTRDAHRSAADPTPPRTHGAGTTEPAARTRRPTATGTADGVGFRTYGKSKDSRDDLPQVVIGMAVTRDGIPVRVWCWPGNTADSALIRQAKDDMRDWTLARIVWVADRGFSSAENRRYLRRGGGHYIIGEKLRSGSAEANAALSRQGRYQHVARQPAGQRSPHRRRRAVRDLLQPRRSRTRRRARARSWSPSSPR